MRRRVLLVEDSVPLATSVAGALGDAGITVVWAASVAAAVEVYDPDRFDVILCDYELPDGTGLDFLATIRGSDKALTILWSGLDRTGEVAASGLHVDHVAVKEKLPETLALVFG